MGYHLWSFSVPHRPQMDVRIVSKLWGAETSRFIAQLSYSAKLDADSGTCSSPTHNMN
jgi:hypothetical protein